MIRSFLSGKEVNAIKQANAPSALNPFATMADVNGGLIVTNVANYSALPDPTTVPNAFYRTISGENASWRPSWLGGTYYPEGIYQSLGGVWDYVGEFPYQATQAEVYAGLNNQNFVTPLTGATAYLFKNSSTTTYRQLYIKNADGSQSMKDDLDTLYLDFSAYTTLSFRAPNDMKIISNTVLDGSGATLSVTVNAAAYTIGSGVTITQGQLVVITASTNCQTKLTTYKV